MELSKDWSCKLSILQACLEEEDCVDIQVYLQDIIYHEECWKDPRLIKTKCKEWNQVDQRTKHRRCTLWDHVISWYGKHCPLCFVY